MLLSSLYSHFPIRLCILGLFPDPPENNQQKTRCTNECRLGLLSTPCPLVTPEVNVPATVIFALFLVLIVAWVRWMRSERVR